MSGWPGTHPDAARLAGVRRAIEHWLDRPAEPAATSAISGSGAVRVCERAFSELHGGRAAALLPNATFGMRVALAAVGVRAGDDVLVPALDWPSTVEAVRSLGARPVAVDVAADTLTIEPAAAAERRTSRTSAVVACHFAGIAADVPALRAALRGVPIIEDAAGAFGSSIDGMPVGTLGELAVLSLGPGKTIDAGEGGVVLSASPELHRRVLALSAHPLRLELSGLQSGGCAAHLGMRVHFMTPILALDALSRWDGAGAVARHDQAVRRLAALGLRLLGCDARRKSAQPVVPVRAAADKATHDRVSTASMGACVVADPDDPHYERACLLLATARVASTLDTAQD